jgi:hypothetical protein
LRAAVAAVAPGDGQTARRRAATKAPPAASTPAPCRRKAQRRRWQAPAVALRRRSEAWVASAFAVTPWGEIFVDGRKRGISPPMQELRLPPGKHVIEIRNTTFAPYRETIDVAADGIVRIKHKFQ